MAQADELKTKRLTQKSPLHAADEAIADLETVLRLITGCPADTVLAEFLNGAAGGDVVASADWSLDNDNNPIPKYTLTNYLTNPPVTTITDYYTGRESLAMTLANMKHFGGVWAHMSRVTNQSIPAVAHTYVDFTAHTNFDDTWLEAVAASDWIEDQRLSTDSSPLYLVHCFAEFATNATGYRMVNASHGGVAFHEKFVPSVTGQPTGVELLFVSTETYGEQVKMRVKQTSAGALNLQRAYMTIIALGAHAERLVIVSP